MYYQNLFESEFVGALLLADRQLSLTFRINGNQNTSQLMTAWNQEPYDLSVLNTLTLNYSFDSGYTFAPLAINVAASAASTSAVQAFEIVNALNANATFAALYNAYTTQDKQGNNILMIRALRAREKWRTYIANTSAEQVLRFNKRAGVAELPSYFSRHTIANTSTYTDSAGLLIELSNPLVGFDSTIVTDAGLSTTVREDWQLLLGRSGLFTFQKITVDGSDRITQIIEFPAGAQAGDFAKKTIYTYTGSNTSPSQITEEPHVMSGDPSSGTGDFVVP